MTKQNPNVLVVYSRLRNCEQIALRLAEELKQSYAPLLPGAKPDIDLSISDETDFNEERKDKQA